MLKKVSSKIQKLEQLKLVKTNKLNDMQKEMDIIDINLKKLYNLKKDYEKLEKNSQEIFEKI